MYYGLASLAYFCIYTNWDEGTFLSDTMFITSSKSSYFIWNGNEEYSFILLVSWKLEVSSQCYARCKSYYS